MKGETDFERLRLTYKRLKVDWSIRDVEIVEQLRRALHKTQNENDELQTACRSHKQHTGQETLALEAEVEILKHEKAQMVLGIKDGQAKMERMMERNAMLEGEVLALKKHVQSALQAKRHRDRSMEGKYQRLLRTFNDYKRRVHEIGGES